MLSSSTRKRARGNIRGPGASLELRIDGLSFGRVRRLHAHRLEAFCLPVNRRDLVRRLQEVLRGLQVDLLPRLRAGLEGLPDDIVQIRERLQVVRFEVVAPEDADLVLRDLRVLLLYQDVPRQLARVLLPLLRRRVRAGLLELV